MPPKRLPFRGPVAPEGYLDGSSHIAWNAWIGDGTRPRRLEELPEYDPEQPGEVVVTTFWLLGHVHLWQGRTDGMSHRPLPFGRRQGAEAPPTQLLVTTALGDTREQRIRQRRLRRVYTWVRHGQVAVNDRDVREPACLPPCHWCGELTSNFCSGRVIVPRVNLAVECGWPICVTCEGDGIHIVCRNCMCGAENRPVSADAFAYGDSESEQEQGALPVQERP